MHAVEEEKSEFITCQRLRERVHCSCIDADHVYSPTCTLQFVRAADRLDSFFQRWGQPGGPTPIRVEMHFLGVKLNRTSVGNQLSKSD